MTKKQRFISKKQKYSNYYYPPKIED